MIECTSEYIYKKKKKLSKKFFSILLLITVIVGVWAYNRFVVFDLVVSYTSSSLSAYSSNAVNSALYDNLENISNYNQIVCVEKNKEGDIVLIEANMVEINKINRNIITKTSSIMSDIINNGVQIPALSFTGISFVGGYGPKVNFKSLSVSKIIGEFRSEFMSSGINQTLHSLYIDVVCNVDIIFPLYKTTIEVVVPVLMCESVLIGKVPEFYLKGNLFS